MAYIDPDEPSASIVEELVKMYEASGDRLRKIILDKNAGEFNHARASQLLAQVQAECNRLKGDASSWTGKALNKAMAKGLAVGDEQLKDAGVKPTGSALQGSFANIQHQAVQLLARDTVGDCYKAADSMARNASSALRQMAATGVSKADVNRILAGGIIEGQPTQAIHQLRDALKKVHGNQVTVPTKSGGSMTFDTGYYAKLVAHNKMREATVKARHGTLQAHGIDLITIVGRVSLNPCTRLLGHVFSLGGRNDKYPAFSTVDAGQLPYRLFHPQCSKSTAPFIEGLNVAAKPSAAKEAA